MRVLNNLMVFINIFLILILFSSCGTKITEVSGNNTDAIKRIQDAVPFTIILPKYLPEELRSRQPTTLGPTEGHYNKESTFIGIMYLVAENSHYVQIDEENTLTVAMPSDQHPYSYFEIAGIRVLEQDWADYLFSDNVRGAPGFVYDWNTSEITITVRMVGYDQAESRKVVESMIK